MKWEHALTDKAVKNKVVLLNEIGLDPGLDHIIAKNMIHSIDNTEYVISFESYCGGLPAQIFMECIWCSSNDAKCINNCKIIEINGNNLFIITI